ncbi:MAG TPA: hypothetical protein VHK06_01885 [Candidatus Limnocylindria bacterium]|nr:hypothetical protein [Candidatus Limnocylindria bacterium]
MPLMMTFFNVRRGRDMLFKRAMRGAFPSRGGFPREMRRLERELGIRFVGWFNVTEGSTWNNVVILDLPNYAVLDRLYADSSTRRLGHWIAESVFERKHTIFLRERMGADLVYHP